MDNPNICQDEVVPSPASEPAPSAPRTPASRWDAQGWEFQREKNGDVLEIEI